MHNYQLASTHGLTFTTLEPLHYSVHLCTYNRMLNSMHQLLSQFQNLAKYIAIHVPAQLASLLSTIARHVLHTTLPLTQARPHDVEHLQIVLCNVHYPTLLRYSHTHLWGQGKALYTYSVI